MLLKANKMTELEAQSLNSVTVIRYKQNAMERLKWHLTRVVLCVQKYNNLVIGHKVKKIKSTIMICMYVSENQIQTFHQN
jgi:hypothetical protein